MPPKKRQSSSASAAATAEDYDTAEISLDHEDYCDAVEPTTAGRGRPAEPPRTEQEDGEVIRTSGEDCCVAVNTHPEAAVMISILVRSSTCPTTTMRLDPKSLTSQRLRCWVTT